MCSNPTRSFVCALLGLPLLALFSGAALGDPSEGDDRGPRTARGPRDSAQAEPESSQACIVRYDRNPSARDHFRNGGDQLAHDLIGRFKRVETSDGDRDVLLFYIAYTESETGFQFVRQRFEARSSLSFHDQIRTIDALGETGHPAAVNVAIRALGRSTSAAETDVARVSPRDFREHLANILWKIPLATGRVTPQGVAAIRQLSAEGWINAKGGLRTLERHFDLETAACKRSP